MFRKRAAYNDWDVSLASNGALTSLMFNAAGDDAVSIATSAGRVPLNVWTKVAMWYDGSSARLYINDTEVARVNKIVRLDWFRDYIKTEIGNDTYDVGIPCSDCDRAFQGDLDEVIISPTRGGTSVPTDAGALSTLKLVSGTIASQSVSPSSRLIVVPAGSSVRGSFDVDIKSAWTSNAVMALGVTPTWDSHAYSYTDLGGFSTPASALRKRISVDMTAPQTPGTYWIIAAFRAEYDASEVLSCTNWSAGSAVWDDGNDVAGWSKATIEAANANGTVSVDYLYPDGNIATYVPATAIQVVVTQPGDPGAGATSTLKLVSGSIAGQTVSPTNRTITVSPSDPIYGTFDVQINSTWASNAVMALGVTPTWGSHAYSYTDLGGFATPVSALRKRITVDLTAPSSPGTYWIIAAFRAEFDASQVISCTNWPLWDSYWDDGNDVADWTTATIDVANAKGTVPVDYLFSSGVIPTYMPATAIKVVVK